MFKVIEARIADLAKQLEHSAQMHNIMLGTKSELENLLKAMKEVAPVVEAVDPALTPVVDAVEAVAAAVE